MLSRRDLHPYQHAAIEFLKAEAARQLIAVMGAGKTTVAEHAIADLKAAGQLKAPALVAAPLMIAESVWQQEAKLWQDTSELNISLVLGPPKKRLASLDKVADVYVTNYDNIQWLAREILRRNLELSVLIADESSKLKNPDAIRTETMMGLSAIAERRWTLTGTPRGHQLTDVWAPAMFVTRGTAFPANFYMWRETHFFTNDVYGRRWFPRRFVEAAVIEQLQPFSHVVDRTALDTRPPVIEIVHDVALDPKSLGVYRELDGAGTTDAAAKSIAAGLVPSSEMAIVTKLMQVCSGASYDDSGEGKWTRLHDRRLDMLQELHDGHDKPTLVFVSYRHEIERIRQRFPAAKELTAERIAAWNDGEIDMLVAHPASAGHGINLQMGSDTIVWFSLPWSAELYAQANARLVRQGQRHTVNIHVLLSRGLIDEVAYKAVHQRLADQERLIEALQ